jgi:hypothetical protein
MSMRGVTLLAVVGLCSLSPYVVAQKAAVPTASDDSAVCTPGVRSYVGYGGINASGEPYSATLKVTFDQKLPDGKVLHSVTRRFYARSSDSKVRMETPIGCELDANGHAYNKLIVRIADPMAGSFLDWNTGGAVLKVAHLIYQPQAMAGTAGISEWVDSEKTTTSGKTVTTTKIETIGPKKIDGVDAIGQRLTSTKIDVSGQGNATPSVTTHEQWISVEHGLLLSDIVDDPARGHTEMIMENLSLKEPDPSLFVPPQGYTIMQTYPATNTTK